MDLILFTLVGVALACAATYAKSRYAGFLSQQPEHYAAKSPQFDLRTHLNGPIQCEGVVYGPLGRVTSTFVADFDAKWDGNVGVMKEEFRYDSGEQQKREWRLTLGNDGKIRAEADDLVGAGEGVQQGAGVKLTYRIKLPKASGGHVLDTTDWMYLVENGAIINRSQFRKYGIKVAELVATMRRKDMT